VKANSIHHSFQRAVTTHDTSYWEVRDNVAYDVMGHTYFMEDGTEFYNSLSGESRFICCLCHLIVAILVQEISVLKLEKVVRF
jgi:hypothetical protein